MKTKMTQLFGIQYPIMCGGMMWLAKPELCAAISNAGGLGNLTAGNYDSADELRDAIRETRSLTDKPFCVNITLMPSVRITKELQHDYIKICCRENVTALEISGAPLDQYFGPEFVEDTKRFGVKLTHKVGAVRHAKHAEKVGYDAVIAAGIEEGGHPLDDDVTTMVLTPRISESVGIPVITAGGIADGRGLAAALALGADGIMMASRFIVTKECLAHENIKNELVRRQEYETTLICKTMEMQMRCLKNTISEKVLEIEAGQGTFEEILPYMVGSRSKAAWEVGDADMAPLAVGQSVGLLKNVVSCKNLLEGMVDEAKVIIGIR